MTTGLSQLPKKCPACNTPLRPTQMVCSSCGMTGKKMLELIKAQELAQAKGMHQAASAGSMRKLVKPIVALLVVAILAAAGYFAYQTFRRVTRPAWLDYPTDPQATISQVFAAIDADTNQAHDHAYTLVSQRVIKNTEADDLIGQYRQLFHVIDQYLRSEIGPGWYGEMKIAPADAAATGPGDRWFTVTVGTEILSVNVEPQGPENGPLPEPYHWGLAMIREFPIGMAAKAQQMAAIQGVMRTLGAGGAVDPLTGIVATGGGDTRRETPMQTKLRLLPVVRNPNGTALKQAVIQLWPIRQDPTVRARLERITTDARYSPDIQETAGRVLASRITEEELIAAGVTQGY